MMQDILARLGQLPKGIEIVQSKEETLFKDSLLLTFFKDRRVNVSEVLYKFNQTGKELKIDTFIMGAEGSLPHIMKNGMVCLGTSFNGDLSRTGLLLESCVKHVRQEYEKILDSDSFYSEFEKEAQHYWDLNLPKSHKTVWFAKPLSAKLPVIEDALGSRNSKHFLFCPELCQHSSSSISLEKIGDKLSLKDKSRMKGLFLPLSHIPPTPKDWPKNYSDLKRFISNRVTKECKDRIFSGKHKLWVLILYNENAGSFAYFLDILTKQIQKAAVSRIDDEWTVGRDQNSKVSQRKNKTIIQIGAGCLGSSVARNLACQGINNISIYDGDDLLPQNLGRHALPASYLNQNKASALVKYLGLSQLFFNGTAYPRSFHDGDQSIGKLDWEKVPIFLNFTGEPSVIYSIEKFRQTFNNCWHIFAFYEPFVLNAHCILTPPNHFLNINLDLIKAIRLTKFTNKVYKKEPGCISTFQSYELRKAEIANSLISNLILDVIDGNLSSPAVYSLQLPRDPELSNYIKEDTPPKSMQFQWFLRQGLDRIWN